MKHNWVRLAGILFLVGALVGALTAPAISQWMAFAAPPAVHRLTPNASAWFLLSLRAAVLVGIVFASVPLAIHFLRAAESSLRTVALLLFTSLSVFAASIFHARMTVAELRPDERGIHVIISPAAASFTTPSLLAIGTVLVGAAILRLIDETSRRSH